MIYHLSDLEQAASFSSAMEQAQFLMWTKRRHSLSSHLKLANSSPAYDDSWEEQAFAEDASGPLGGCIWPPRSYSCSFCRREFRSAQALGGHMNVHRRDRARLKQSPIASNEILDPEHRQNQATQFPNSFVSLGLPYPHNPNPNCDLPPFVSPTSPSRVSAPPSEGSCNELTLIPPYPSYGVTEHCTKSPTRSPQSWPNSAIDRCRHIINRPVIGEKHMKIVDHGQRVKEDHIKGDVPLSLNWVFRARPDPSLDTEEEHSCKRRRTDISSPLPFFLKSTAGDKNQQEKEVQELTSNPSNDVDLELRLGAPPKVKVQS